MSGMQWGPKVLPEGRLVFTQKGYVGAVISDVLPGGEVWVPKGCKLPVILRKIGDRVVGSAYVYGTMSGEAMEHAKRENKGTETVIIR